MAFPSLVHWRPHLLSRTRDFIVARTHSGSAANGDAKCPLCDGEIAASLDPALAGAPVCGQDLWLFAYGPVMGKPELDLSARRWCPSSRGPVRTTAGPRDPGLNPPPSRPVPG